MENYFFRKDSVVDQSSQEVCVSSGVSLDSIEESSVVEVESFNEQYYLLRKGLISFRPFYYLTYNWNMI